MKIQPIEEDKIFLKHISGKGLVYRIYRELLQLNKEKTNIKNGQTT